MIRHGLVAKGIARALNAKREKKIYRDYAVRK
jgi:hypothetical protein